MENYESNETCCAKCRFFDTRTCFCRLNPPQIVIAYANRMSFPNAVWPKIPMPDLDYCSYFDQRNDEP